MWDATSHLIWSICGPFQEQATGVVGTGDSKSACSSRPTSLISCLKKREEVMLQASSAMGQASPSHYSCPAIMDCTLNHESKYSFHSLSCFCLAFCHSNENDNMPVLSDLFHRIFLLIPGPYQPPLSSAGIPVSTPAHESCKILSLFLCPLQPSPFMSAHINTIALPWEHSGSSNSKLLNQLTHTMMNLPCDL